MLNLLDTVYKVYKLMQTSTVHSTKLVYQMSPLDVQEAPEVLDDVPEVQGVQGVQDDVHGVPEAQGVPDDEHLLVLLQRHCLLPILPEELQRLLW